MQYHRATCGEIYCSLQVKVLPANMVLTTITSQPEECNDFVLCLQAVQWTPGYHRARKRLRTPFGIMPMSHLKSFHNASSVMTYQKYYGSDEKPVIGLIVHVFPRKKREMATSNLCWRRKVIYTCIECKKHDGHLPCIGWLGLSRCSTFVVKPWESFHQSTQKWNASS